MKTQNMTNKISKILFTALASLVMMNAACQKSSSNSTPPPPVVTPTCTIQPCAGPGVVGGQMLYGGTTAGSNYGAQAQFQVNGDVSGNGMGSIAGSVNFNNFVCQVGQPNLMGAYNIQMSQQGYLQSDVFTGQVMLVGPQGSVAAGIKVIPTRTQGTGLFTLYLTQCQNPYSPTGYSVIDLNF